MALNQPVGQIRLTNIAVVRYKAQGKRFEIACYRNKVLDWRNKLEKDINEVLQSDSVYTNVSRGTLANRKELEQVFGTGDLPQVISIILDKGQLQVSKKEREQDMNNKFTEIATIIADKCINAETKRPFAVEMIEQSMKDLHINVKPNKGAKQQALDVIQLLQKTLPIARTQMRVRVESPAKVAKEIKIWLSQQAQSSTVVQEDLAAAYASELILQIDPGLFRSLDEKVQALTRGQGLVEVQDLKADLEEGEEGGVHMFDMY